jgi:hypothetical protein
LDVSRGRHLLQPLLLSLRLPVVAAAAVAYHPVASIGSHRPAVGWKNDPPVVAICCIHCFHPRLPYSAAVVATALATPVVLVVAAVATVVVGAAGVREGEGYRAEAVWPAVGVVGSVAEAAWIPVGIRRRKIVADVVVVGVSDVARAVPVVVPVVVVVVVAVVAKRSSSNVPVQTVPVPVVVATEVRLMVGEAVVVVVVVDVGS